MMKAISLATALMLSGCATVSMVSKTAVIESETTEQQSELRLASEKFQETAESEGWVSESRSLVDFASILFGGKSEQTDRASDSYAERVSATDAELPAVYQQISADALQASSGLEALDLIARSILAGDDVSRADLISFESALVVAQKSYRSFAEATGIAQARGEDGLDGTDIALMRFAEAIDAARKSADNMATAYASESKSDSAVS